MSFERARVNCRRCYELANDILKEPMNQRIDIYQDNDHYSARNEAMRALEEVNTTALERVRTFIQLSSKGEMKDIIGRANECLKACECCNYSKPSIVKFLDRVEGAV